MNDKHTILTVNKLNIQTGEYFNIEGMWYIKAWDRFCLVAQERQKELSARAFELMREDFENDKYA